MVKVNCPVPNASVLAVAPELEKPPQLNVKDCNDKVPAVNVTVLVLPIVKASSKENVPVALNVIGKSNILPLVVMVSDPAPEKVVANVPAVNVPLEAGTIKLP